VHVCMCASMDVAFDTLCNILVFFSSIGKCSYESYHRNEMCLVIEQTELLKVGDS